MRDIAVIQHEEHQGPGFLLNCLHDLGLRTRLLRPDLGDALPRRASDFAGLVVLGSEHSVHDGLAWIAAERALLADALSHDVPVLAHCFGAQQLSLAAGGRVTRNTWPNIGWSSVWVTPQARALFGGAERVDVFNWHYDTFEIPRGAHRTLFGPHCLNKGFALGPHLAFQCHLEVTALGVRRWCETGTLELAQARGPAAQSARELLTDLPQRTERLHGLARRVYQHWAQGLARPPRLALPAVPRALQYAL